MRAYQLVFVILFFILNSCKTTVGDTSSITITELKINRVDYLFKQKQNLENQVQTPEIVEKLKEINKELNTLTQSICKALDTFDLCGDCSGCNSNCSQEGRISDWLNCARKGVLAGGKCSSCPTKPIKHLLLINPSILSNNILTKVTFRDANTNALIKTVDLRNLKLKKTNIDKVFAKNIKRYNINSKQKYNITVEEILPNGATSYAFTIEDYAF